MRSCLSSCLIFFLAASYVLYGQGSYILKIENENALRVIESRFDGEIKLNRVIDNSIRAFRKMAGNSTLSANQISLLDKLGQYYVLAAEGLSENEIHAALSEIDGIAGITPNYYFTIDSEEPDDERFDEQWGLEAVNALKAWDRASGKGILVGVVDTGIDFGHPDLAGQIWINPAEDFNGNGHFDPWPSDEERDGTFGDLNGIDDDANGYVDDVVGYDFVDQKVMNLGDSFAPDPYPADEHGHGTTVSGIIAAEKDNGIGIAGLAFNSKIVVLRAMDVNGGGESDDIATAIVYAALNGVKVINLSFGERFDTPLIHDAVRFAFSMGSLVVASSGNNGWDLNHYPSDYDEVISVGASTVKSMRDYRSNYGSRLDLLAPGTGILSTQLGSSYKLYDGTSMAAPHVSAVAAMLLETDPTYSPDDIRGIIKASARDIEENGWDLYTGNGILDAENTLEMRGRTNLKFEYPQNEYVINRDKITKLTVTGSAATPLFESFQLFIAEGGSQRNDTAGAPEKQYSWTTVTDTLDEQVVNGKLGEIDISGLKDTNYTIRLRVNLKNMNTLEKRIQIYIVSGDSTLEITDIETAYPFFEDERAVFIGAKTNFKASFKVRFRPKGGSDKYQESAEMAYKSNYHSILIDRELALGEYEAEALAWREGADTSLKTFTFVKSREAMPRERFSRKEYSTRPAYIHGNVETIYGNNPAIAVNDFSNATWGAAKIYNYIEGRFEAADSTDDIWIPVGMGDSNGDGINEVLAYRSGQTMLFQAENPGGNPFASAIFTDTLLYNFWASAMSDIDGDGLPEVLGYSDTAYHAITYKNGAYRHLAMAMSDNPYKYIGTFPGIATGDFNGNGKTEICFGNDRGNIFIWEYNGGGFDRIFIDEVSRTSGSQHIASGDIDGDGTPEILLGNFGTNLFIENNSGGDPLWLFRILKFTGSKYEYVWEDYVYGVRGGLGYRNAVALGNLDGEQGDEIIFSPFPNLYVMKWNSAESIMEPLWFYDAAFTNSAIIHDFDGNGINELGFNGIFYGPQSSGMSVSFFEYDMDYAGPATPTGFDGRAADGSSALFRWNASPDAEEYYLYRLVDIGGETFAEPVDTTTETSSTVTGLAKDAYYDFVLRAYNSNMEENFSGWTPLVRIFTHEPIEPTNIILKNMNKILEVSFSGRLGREIIDPGYFTILDENKNYLSAPVGTLFANDTTLILTFAEALSPGNRYLSVEPFPDYYGTLSRRSDFGFKIDETTPKEELYLLKLDVITKTELSVEFSEPVRESGAVNFANYTFNPELIPKDILLSSSNNARLRIYLDPVKPIGAFGKSYTLTVRNVVAQSGVRMTTGAGNTLGFVFTAENLEDAFVYPNPVRLSSDDEIYFAGLPARAEVVIMTLGGDVLRRLNEFDGNGGTEWDGRDSRGEKLGTGVYLFKVIEKLDDGGERISSFKKFAVMR